MHTAPGAATVRPQWKGAVGYRLGHAVHPLQVSRSVTQQTIISTTKFLWYHCNLCESKPETTEW